MGNSATPTETRREIRRRDRQLAQVRRVIRILTIDPRRRIDPQRRIASAIRGAASEGEATPKEVAPARSADINQAGPRKPRATVDERVSVEEVEAAAEAVVDEVVAAAEAVPDKAVAADEEDDSDAV